MRCILQTICHWFGAQMSGSFNWKCSSGFRKFKKLISNGICGVTVISCLVFTRDAHENDFNSINLHVKNLIEPVLWKKRKTCDPLEPFCINLSCTIPFPLPWKSPFAGFLFQKVLLLPFTDLSSLHTNIDDKSHVFSADQRFSRAGGEQHFPPVFLGALLLVLSQFGSQVLFGGV